MTTTTTRSKAVCLLSGGLDSVTTLAVARSRGFDVYAMTFRYGQRHVHELECARQSAGRAGVAGHVFVEIDLRPFGGSALTDDRIDVPKHRSADDMGHGIPVTYVPARNTIFLSYALAYAETLGAVDLFIGVNALDYSGYPDCRPEYIAAFQAMARLGTERKQFTVHAPLVHLTKAQIIRRGVELGVDYAMTHSCYNPVEREGQALACGHCDSCLLRKKGFVEAGVADVTRYA